MKKNGFTLMELLGVIVILGLICLVAFPPILDTVRKNKNNINEATYQIIYSAANIYINNHKSEFELVENNEYCIKIQTLIDEDNLTSDLKDPDTNLEFNTNKYVKVLVKDAKYTYSIVDNCEGV